MAEVKIDVDKFNQPNTAELLEWCGGDKLIATAAWVSTSRQFDVVAQENLIDRLMRDGHTSPFEHCMLTFRLRTDLATHIHFLKHRHLSINAESARYRELSDTYYVPHDFGPATKEVLEGFNASASRAYHLTIQSEEEGETMSRKRAKETARYFLPMSRQISFIVTMNFHAFMKLYLLRASEHAQAEISKVVQTMFDLIAKSGGFPFACQAFWKYHIARTTTLSRNI